MQKEQSMLRITNVSKSYENALVLSKISLSLVDGEKAALVGSNGCGKSTLLKIISGLDTKDSGSIEITDDCQITYLPQEITFEKNENVKSYLLRVTGIRNLTNELSELENKLNSNVAIERYSIAQQKFTKLGGYEIDHRISAILAGMNLENCEEIPISNLSGGQKSKVLLAGVLLINADLLLLDEPTNNLDLPALIWLEQFLIQSSASCLIVSHDRDFLDKIATKTFEIDWLKRTVTPHHGRYSDFLSAKKEAFVFQTEQHQNQKDEISRLEETAKEKKEWASKGRGSKRSDNDKLSHKARQNRSAKLAQQAKSLEKRIEQFNIVERPVSRDPLRLDIISTPSKAMELLRGTNLVCGYQNSFRLMATNLVVYNTSRIGIIGANGSGKSTLIKTLAKKLEPLQGFVNKASKLQMGVLDQEIQIPRNISILDYIRNETHLDLQFTYYLLSKFQFAAKDSGKQLENLSPGERMRLMMAIFSVNGTNLLMLDEPTNHLDMEAIEGLESAICSFEGALVVITHDRRFLEKINLSEHYIIDQGSLIKVSDLDAYYSSLEQEAQELILRLK